MIGTKQEIYSVLREYNTWWDGGGVRDLPNWKRAAFRELKLWVETPPSPRAVLISGARQVGKTTLLRQAIKSLIDSGVASERILYVTFDHPLLKLAGREAVISLWEETRPSGEGPEYLFLDEIQNTDNWQTWIKHQVDFKKNRRISVTGSAMPLNEAATESGVGRWKTIKLPTLSFYEYLKINQVKTPDIPNEPSLAPVFLWAESKFLRVSQQAKPLVPHFHEYLLRGGFPETSMVGNVSIAQKLMREDIVDKVLKRDMTAVYGVRNVLDLEKLFLYLCLHDGGILDATKISKNLGITRPTVNNFISLLESAHLIYKLNPYGYGIDVLKGKPKVYLADAAISGSVMLKGKSLLQDLPKLGAAVETVFFKHLYTRYYAQSFRCSYWRKDEKYEVDIICELSDRVVPFEVKYKSNLSNSDFGGLARFCDEKNLSRAYLISREPEHFNVKNHETGLQTLVIPAPLACYWLSKSEFDSTDLD